MQDDARKFFFRSNGYLISLSLFLYLFSCAPMHISTPTINQAKDSAEKADYSKIDYWASHPWKKDAADNIPADIKNKITDSVADVFFIHPTTYTDVTMPMGWNGDMSNDVLNKKTDNSSILYQASVFNEQCRVFAPRYRQANLKAFYTTNKEDADKAFAIGYNDIKAAFEYYLKYNNGNKPIIIASHSQGTLHAVRLLKEFFEGKPLQKKLICAYLIGLPVFTNYFKEIKPCSDSATTECFVSWRTLKKDMFLNMFRKKRKGHMLQTP